MLSVLFAFVSTVTAAQSFDASTDWVIPAGLTVTLAPPLTLTLHDLRIETGATLRISSGIPLHVHAHGRIVVDGTLDLSGVGYSAGVVSSNTSNLQQPGFAGGPGGGTGGMGNPLNFASCPKGGDAMDPPVGGVVLGGRGGESGYNPTNCDDCRRAAGGGGGKLGPDLQLVDPNPYSNANAGRVARAGLPGALQALSSVGLRPQGGSTNPSPFVDGNPNNDFFGHMFDPITQSVIVGELAHPLGGRGGGGGGNAIHAATFPAAWTHDGDEIGAGGGGGGGLCTLIAQGLEIGPNGRIVCDGGPGGGGENTIGFNHIGGGSGGGSGGMVLVQARRIDLSMASNACVHALGGRGGPGANDVHGVDGSGGDGGPGIVQFHLANGINDVLLPPGKTLEDMTLPAALVLLPEPNL